MFGAIRNLCKKVLDLDQVAILEEALQDSGIQELIIELNQSQLFDVGIEADGTPTGNYSEVSVTKYGKEPGHITLHDTGETYDSMKVITGDTGFQIIADMDLHGVDLNVIYPHALGLTEDSLAILIPKLRTVMIIIIKEKLKIA